MALPAAIRQTIEEQLTAYCLRTVPLRYRNQLRLNYKLRGNSVTLLEEREPVLPAGPWVSRPVAQFRYAPDSGQWVLYGADRNGRWLAYHLIEPTTDFSALLQIMDADKTGLFWG